jgi:hypothetical protein
VNPSGKTTDIWAADFTADPTFKNFGGKRYTDIEGYYPQKSTGNAYFVEYVEGLYYGYRYYETAAAEAEAGNYSGFDYDSAVVFPFGYGLSYTTFSQTLDSVNADEENVKVEVTVSNTGSVAGKDVVEVYYSAPYTAGGLEKAAVVLGGFAKTDALDPGASQQVTIEFPVRDMASYSSDDQAYVLDAGDYVISLRTDSHTVVGPEDRDALCQEVHDRLRHRGADLQQVRRHDGVHGEERQHRFRRHRLLRGVRGGPLLWLSLLRDRSRRSRGRQLRRFRLRQGRCVPVWLWSLVHHVLADA